MTDDRPLRVGLVGAGVIAHLAQFPVLSAAPGVTIAGLVDVSREAAARAASRWPVERLYDTTEQLLDGADLDAVFVLTPKHLHADVVRTALQAGVDVYCEKPLSGDLEQARELVSLADSVPSLLMVGLNRRFCPVYRQAHEALAGRVPQFLVGQKNRVGSEYRATLENGVHMLDLLRWFGGEVRAVTGASHGADPYAEDGAAALLQFESGSTGLFLASRTAGEWDERLELHGDRTTIRVIAPDEVTVIKDGVASTRHQRAAQAGWVDLTRSAGFDGAIEHFLTCVRTREQPMTDAHEALRTQELTEQVLAACGLPTADAPTTEGR